MPRHPDPQLEERILRAAQKLWKKGGEEGLTMRAVAKAAGTNTPAVYRRFKNRQEILRCLMRQTQRDLGEVLRQCQSPQEICQRYVDHVVNRAHEFELFFEQAHKLPRPARAGQSSSLREIRPNIALVEDKLAEWLGGAASDHSCLALSMWIVAHGTARILISKAVPEQYFDELRSVFTATIETLVQNAYALSSQDQGVSAPTM
jgi:AcrR family transcriptional regulator